MIETVALLIACWLVLDGLIAAMFAYPVVLDGRARAKRRTPA
jgi:hypothetical protein